MLRELERGGADHAALNRLRDALVPGPWYWPSNARDDALELARTATGCSEPPPPSVGVTPGVTLEGNCALVWLLGSLPAPAASTEADLGETCRDSWSAAALALPRAVPLLWTSVSVAHARKPRLHLVGSYLKGSGVEPSCRLVQGPSFGLAFFLILASRTFGVPLPGDLIAFAAVNEDGRVGPVDGLELKLEAVSERMPGVQRVLISAEQEGELPLWAKERLQVIAIATGAQALEVVFGNQLPELLLKEGSDPSRRQELADWFFRFAFQGRSELVDWSPIAAAAKLALERWPALTEGQRFQLAFARGVAERHEMNAGRLPVPPLCWLLTKPVPLRCQLAAHLVQQLADAGNPSWPEVEPIVTAVRASAALESHQMQLRLEGALARLQAVTGRPGDALIRQEELARVYFDCLLYSEISFPLAEWYRLSGIVGDRAAFGRADQMKAAVESAGGFGLHGSVYVQLSRCKASVLLHHGQNVLVEEGLTQLADDRRAPEHVRWSAVRWLLRVRGNDASRRNQLSEALAQAASVDERRRRHAAAVNVALAELDAAVAGEDYEKSRTALGRLRQLEPALMAHLLAAADGDDPGPFVSIHYPY